MPVPAPRRSAVILLLACGAVLWALIGDGRGMGAIRWGLLAIAIGLGALPPVRRTLVRLLDRVRNPSQRMVERTSVLVGVLASTYFTFTAFHQDRDLFPK